MATKKNNKTRRRPTTTTKLDKAHEWLTEWMNASKYACRKNVQTKLLEWKFARANREGKFKWAKQKENQLKKHSAYNNKNINKIHLIRNKTISNSSVLIQFYVRPVRACVVGCATLSQHGVVNRLKRKQIKGNQVSLTVLQYNFNFLFLQKDFAYPLS